MEQVYWLTNTFIDLIIRDDVLPATINLTMIHTAVMGGLEETVSLVQTHWQDLLLQYVGLLTAVVVGLLTALIIFTNNMNGAKEKALMQEDMYADLLSAYVDHKRQEEGHLKPNQHPGVHLGLMLDLLNQLVALPIMENHPHLTILPSNSF